MTVFEMLDAILKRYAGADPEALASFKPVYYARFGKREGPHLQAAFDECCAGFKPTARQPFPIPGDIEDCMPSIKRTEKGEKPLDFKSQRDRYERLMWNWRAAQGDRVSKGIPEVMRALEFIACPIAAMMAWQDNPPPLLLTTTSEKPGVLPQVRLAWHRALSQERRKRHGDPPKNADLWFEQIEAIGVEWGVKLKREDWESTTKKPDQKAAA